MFGLESRNVSLIQQLTLRLKVVEGLEEEEPTKLRDSV